MRSLSCLLLLVGAALLGGCGGDDGSAPACTGATYDPCTDNSQCMSGNCREFMSAGIQVCTQPCTPGDNATCPIQEGEATECNNMSICRPPMANDCSR